MNWREREMEIANMRSEAIPTPARGARREKHEAKHILF